MDVSDEDMLTWESQASQYAQRGEPGIRYERHTVGSWPIDCLLYRGPSGYLFGILNHYPVDCPPYEKAGNINFWVRPDQRRRGIGTKLILEARRRWEIRGAGQRFTTAGFEHFSKLRNLYPHLDLDRDESADVKDVEEGAPAGPSTEG